MGSAAWGGVKYDHYPDIGKDGKGGAAHCERLVRRILDEGHQITNHGYRHIIFGKKPFVYGQREYLGGVDRAVDDLNRLIKQGVIERYGKGNQPSNIIRLYYLITHSPPH